MRIKTHKIWGVGGGCAATQKKARWRMVSGLVWAVGG
jgi:hypothetical protein